MVKNTTGGTGTKALARKNQSQSSNRIQLSQDPLEVYGYVSKMFGNGMCEITLNDDKKMIGHIRGKFRGKQKRNNLLTVSSMVLVGLRDWENPIKNCDIMVIYDDNQVEQMKTMPNIQIEKIVQLKMGYTKKDCLNDNISFINENVLEQSLPDDAAPEFNMEQIDEVDIDDI